MVNGFNLRPIGGIRVFAKKCCKSLLLMAGTRKECHFAGILATLWHKRILRRELAG
jgi:hypothetical protein